MLSQHQTLPEVTIWNNIFFKISTVKICNELSGHALGIWICGCSLFYKIELRPSKSAGFNNTKILKICGCKRWCLKDLQVRAPVLTHSLSSLFCCIWIDLKRHDMSLINRLLCNYFRTLITKSRLTYLCTYVDQNA